MALCAILDYSGRKAATVGSVLVTNLKTGLRKGGSDRVEVLFAPTFFIQSVTYLCHQKVQN
jgi:hypothetical protein